MSAMCRYISEAVQPSALTASSTAWRAGVRDPPDDDGKIVHFPTLDLKRRARDRTGRERA